MNVIIVDDEPMAIDLINSYLAHFADFNVKATFRNGLKALAYLNTKEVDVVFLDISMPHLSGLSLARMIGPTTAVVFTTAYSEHAVESYAVDAVDYLLKPISLDRFSKTITKLLTRSVDNRPPEPGNATETILLKSGLVTHRVKTTSLLYLEKDGNYIHYVFPDKKIMARQSIATAIKTLPGNFVRIHKSFIVNLKEIDSLAAGYVMLGEHRLPTGARFRSILLEKIGQ